MQREKRLTHCTVLHGVFGPKHMMHSNMDVLAVYRYL